LNFNGGAGWDDLYVHNDDRPLSSLEQFFMIPKPEWFGLLRSQRRAVTMAAVYPNCASRTQAYVNPEAALHGLDLG
jgi:hypothetical protein